MIQSDAKTTIRLANAADAEAILAIYQPHVMESGVSFEYDLPSVRDMANRIEASKKRHVWLVYEVDQEIAGYAYASDFRSRHAYRWICEVSVYIHEHHQRKGIAKALYLALHDVLRLQGFVSAMAVMTFPNPVSQLFHEKMGYVLLPVLKNLGYKFNQWYDVAFMRLELNEPTAHHNETRSIEDVSAVQLKRIFDEIID